jgi:Flp pilus assembly protein TadG
MGQRRRTARRRTVRGAAAVEFALVLPILLVLVFGIINYGLYFNDSINARQGVREAARQVAVHNFTLPAGAAASCSATLGAKIKCITKASVGALSGPAYVAIKPPTNWTRGSSITICTVVKPSNLAGYVPMPASARAMTSMSIEVDDSTLTAATMATNFPSPADTLPAGLSWPTGCT